MLSTNPVAFYSPLRLDVFVPQTPYVAFAVWCAAQPRQGLGYCAGCMWPNYFPCRCLCAQSELKSFLVEITAIIMNKQDDKAPGYLVDKIVDQTGSKGTGGWGGRLVGEAGYDGVYGSAGTLTGNRPRGGGSHELLVSGWQSSDVKVVCGWRTTCGLTSGINDISPMSCTAVLHPLGFWCSSWPGAHSDRYGHVYALTTHVAALRTLLHRRQVDGAAGGRAVGGRPHHGLRPGRALHERAQARAPGRPQGGLTFDYGETSLDSRLARAVRPQERCSLAVRNAACRTPATTCQLHILHDALDACYCTTLVAADIVPQK